MGTADLQTVLSSTTAGPLLRMVQAPEELGLVARALKRLWIQADKLHLFHHVQLAARMVLYQAD